MPSLNIHLFGNLQIYDHEQVPIILGSRKAQELFCYLVLHREKPHSRDKLASLLSTNELADKANKCLRQALWQLQSALNSHLAAAAAPPILIESDYIQFNPGTQIWLDVSEFEQAYALSQGTPGHKLDDLTAAVLDAAIELYRGNLLEGWYQEWCLFEQERLQNMYLTMLVKLIRYCETHQLYEVGFDYGQRVLALDKAHERAHRQMMRLLYLGGNRTGALRQYERCVAALDEELGVRPAKSTENLYKEICGDEVERLMMANSADTTPEAFRATSLALLLEDIQRLRTDFARLQQGLEQNIRTMRRMLDDQVNHYHIAPQDSRQSNTSLRR